VSCRTYKGRQTRLVRVKPCTLSYQAKEDGPINHRFPYIKVIPVRGTYDHLDNVWKRRSMNNPTLTPFPVPTFENVEGDASPEQFLSFLRTLILENLDGDPSMRIPAANKDTWVTVVVGLADHFLASFPSSNSVSWSAIHEKVNLVQVTLEVIQRVSSRVDGVFLGPGDLAQKVFTRLLNLCNVLEVWISIEVPKGDGVPTPLDLREHAFQVTVGLLRCLGGNVPTAAGSDGPTWKILRNILTESLDVIHGLCTPTFTIRCILIGF